MEILLFLQVQEESDATTKPFTVDTTMLESHITKMSIKLEIEIILLLSICEGCMKGRFYE